MLPLPPYGPAPGPRTDDAAVLAAFAGDEAAGHSPRLHVEGPALVVDGDIAAGLRLSPDVVMVRVDLPEEADDVRRPLEAALKAEAMVLFDESSTLALPVALQVLGLRLSSWDLWGRDLDDAFAALRRAATGDQELPAQRPECAEETVAITMSER
ncbi:MAG: hypothetical protein M3063_08720 [Actinomycetota bacterium]|nr:hypothetical protein [Actinomycetota bacterium]